MTVPDDDEVATWRQEWMDLTREVDLGTLLDRAAAREATPQELETLLRLGKLEGSLRAAGVDVISLRRASPRHPPGA